MLVKSVPLLKNVESSKISATDTDLSFLNEIIKKLIAENKINDNFKIIEESKNGDLIQSTDEAQTLAKDELMRP